MGERELERDIERERASSIDGQKKNSSKHACVAMFVFVFSSGYENRKEAS